MTEGTADGQGEDADQNGHQRDGTDESKGTKDQGAVVVDQAPAETGKKSDEEPGKEQDEQAVGAQAPEAPLAVETVHDGSQTQFPCRGNPVDSLL